MRASRSATLAGALLVLFATGSTRTTGASGETVAQRLAALRHEQALGWNAGTRSSIAGRKAVF